MTPSLKQCYVGPEKEGLNHDKGIFRNNKVTYFGHVLSADGLRPDLLKMQGIHDILPSITRDVPETVLGIGMVTYLGKFEPNFAEVTVQLRDLTKKEIMCIWDAVREKSYEAGVMQATRSSSRLL